MNSIVKGALSASLLFAIHVSRVENKNYNTHHVGKSATFYAGNILSCRTRVAVLNV